MERVFVWGRISLWVIGDSCFGVLFPHLYLFVCSHDIVSFNGFFRWLSEVNLIYWLSVFFFNKSSCQKAFELLFLLAILETRLASYRQW